MEADSGPGASSSSIGAGGPASLQGYAIEAVVQGESIGQVCGAGSRLAGRPIGGPPA